MHYHFIGIGGIGMGAVASLLAAKGHTISGSDLKENDITRHLAQMGARIYKGHHAGQIKGADCIVYSSAVREDNPEFAAAISQGITILRRARVLADLMQDRYGITVGGAHGKTTTTSFISKLLIDAHMYPTTAIGGIIHGDAGNAALGKSDYFVAEVDESDGSFLYFHPKLSIITNIDLEHLDFYPDWDAVIKAYREFISNTHPKGTLVICGDDEKLLDLTVRSGKKYRTYGFKDSFHVYAQNIICEAKGSRFVCYADHRKLGVVELIVPGKHNVANALACITAGLSLGIDFKQIVNSLKTFPGVRRRFHYQGEYRGAKIIDDYAHHPSEIKAVLETAQLMRAKRVVAVFQPHRYSRVKGLMNEFAKSLTLCDELIVTDIYAASETPIEGVSAQRLVEVIQENKGPRAAYLPKDKIVPYLKSSLKEGDLVLMLGAGDITQISIDLLANEAQPSQNNKEAVSQKIS